MNRRTNNSQHTSIRFNETLKQKIETAAIDSNMTMTEWIRRACEEKLERQKYDTLGLSEPKAAYVNSHLIDAIKYALTLDEVKKIILDIIWGKNGEI